MLKLGYSIMVITSAFGANNLSSILSVPTISNSLIHICHVSNTWHIISDKFLKGAEKRRLTGLFRHTYQVIRFSK